MRFVALVLILMLSGCLEPTAEDGRVFTVETLDRSEDAGPMYSMKDNLSEGPVLVLFIGVGCIGCKDWTDDLREHHEDWMAQDPPLQIVSVERYLRFETKEDVAEDHQRVRGVIIALDDDKRIRRALQIAQGIDFYRYEVKFSLIPAS